MAGCPTLLAFRNGGFHRPFRRDLSRAFVPPWKSGPLGPRSASVLIRPLGPVVAERKTDQFQRDRAPITPFPKKSKLYKWSEHFSSRRSPRNDERSFKRIRQPTFSSKSFSTIAPRENTFSTNSSSCLITFMPSSLHHRKFLLNVPRNSSREDSRFA